MPTLAILFTNYGPYHVARLEGCQQVYRQSNWNVVGLELACSQAAYAWRPENKTNVVSIFPDQQLEQIKFVRLIQRFFTVLSEVSPDALAIAGYARPTMLLALLWCLWHGKIAILLSDSKEDDAPRSWWRETLKSWILKGYKAALVAGQTHKSYLVKLGMAPNTIFLGYDVVANEIFSPQKIKCLPRPVEKPYFLAVNRFIPEKNIFGLISSYAAYYQKADSRAWDLVLCGDGQLRCQIEQYIAELALQNVVHLPGFLQQNELLPYLAHASCFVHASIKDTWGLVVNEAMAAGLPVLVSKRCGCFEDLVIEGKNGFGFAPEKPEQLAELMRKISSKTVDLKVMGAASFEHIQNFSPIYFAESLMQAVESALVHN
ncbi:glycosyltransferase [Coleofasciculus sp. FACHB-SPT9]|nr:glycosyltransferase [Coleofasciculus sp. FACHB-SPT9]MBD1889379.1 glycosyltransferase [Coleofasciculus sp. FACHB-SPT9]